MATSRLWIPCLAAHLPATNAPSVAITAGTNWVFAQLSFPGSGGASADTSASWQTVVPEGYTANANFDIRIYWTPAGGATVGRNVSWDVSYIGRVNDEVLDTAATATVTVNDLVLAVGDLHVISATFASPTLDPGDFLMLKLNRDYDEADGGTAETVAALLLGMQFVEA